MPAVVLPTRAISSGMRRSGRRPGSAALDPAGPGGIMGRSVGCGVFGPGASACWAGPLSGATAAWSNRPMAGDRHLAAEKLQSGAGGWFHEI